MPAEHDEKGRFAASAGAKADAASKKIEGKSSTEGVSNREHANASNLHADARDAYKAAGNTKMSDRHQMLKEYHDRGANPEDLTPKSGGMNSMLDKMTKRGGSQGLKNWAKSRK